MIGNSPLDTNTTASSHCPSIPTTSTIQTDNPLSLTNPRRINLDTYVSTYASYDIENPTNLQQAFRNITSRIMVIPLKPTKENQVICPITICHLTIFLALCGEFNNTDNTQNLQQYQNDIYAKEILLSLLGF